MTWRAGRFLIRLCDLVGAPRGRSGPYFRLPGRGGHLGGPATKWGGRGRPAGHRLASPEYALQLGLPGGSGSSSASQYALISRTGFCQCEFFSKSSAIPCLFQLASPAQHGFDTPLSPWQCKRMAQKVRWRWFRRKRTGFPCCVLYGTTLWSDMIR
jgi:hypothetical protein